MGTGQFFDIIVAEYSTCDMEGRCLQRRGNLHTVLEPAFDGCSGVAKYTERSLSYTWGERSKYLGSHC